MARREGLSDEAGRLLRVVALMPLASAGDLAPILETSESWLRRALRALASAGWWRRCGGVLPGVPGSGGS